MRRWKYEGEGRWTYDGQTFEELDNEARGDSAFYAALQVAHKLSKSEGDADTSQKAISDLRRKAVEKAVAERTETVDPEFTEEDHKNYYSGKGVHVSHHVLLAALQILKVRAQDQLVQQSGGGDDQQLVNQGNPVKAEGVHIVYRGNHFAVLAKTGDNEGERIW